MPGGDGTGPYSGGSGRGRGRTQGNQPGIGLGGNCVCPSCGKIMQHQRGVPCNQMSCPDCGAKMIRQG